MKEVPGESYVRLLMAIKAHKPPKGPQNPKFGSLIHFAEIWSLAWSPNNSLIATSSEDQTTQIWDLNGELVMTLRGHTAAVTSVDWQPTSIGEMLATCAGESNGP